MQFRPVQTGDSLSGNFKAAEWNKVREAARDYYASQLGGTGSTNKATAGTKQAGVILIKNASGSDQPQFAVLGIDAPIVLPGAAGNEDEFRRQVALSCVTPVDPDHVAKFVITLEPLGADAIGRACIDGVCAVKINVTDEAHTTAGIIDTDATKLESGKPGCPIVWKEAGTGELWGIVQLGAGTGTTTFKARINSAAALTTNRWAYSFTEVVPEQLGKYKELAGGRTGTAYNDAEAGNEGGALGNGATAASIPSGWELLPIGVGAVVDIQAQIDCNGATMFTFGRNNIIWGVC